MKTRLKKLFGILLSFVMGISLMPGNCLTAHAESQTLIVGGTNVTDSVTSGEGWSYNSGTQTLTLNNAEIHGSTNYAILAGNIDLTIEVIGDCTVAGPNVSTLNSSYGIRIQGGSLTIDGTGKLNVIGGNAEGNSYGIYATSGIDVRGNLFATGGTAEIDSFGIYNQSGVVAVSGKLEAEGNTNAIHGNVKGSVSGAGWTDTAEASIELTDEPQELSYKRVQLPKMYHIWVGGVQVTSSNASNITGATTATASYDDTTKTLTLNGYRCDNESGGYEYSEDDGFYAAIYAKQDLTIKLVGTNKVLVGHAIPFHRADGIYLEDGDLTITGNGNLTTEGYDIDGDGIYVYGTLLISEGTTTAESEYGCAIEAEDLAITGGTTTAESECGKGIEADNLLITGGTLTASGHFAGIYCAYDATIEGGSVSAIGDADCGIRDDYGTVEIKGGEVTATGPYGAIDGTVKNAITGAGWSDVAGTKGKESIEVIEGGQELTHKRVKFPMTAAEVAKAPTAKTLTYTGSAQELVVAGKAKDGTMQYALGKNSDTMPTTGWSASVPKGTKAGIYYVYYKAVGDSTHIDSAEGGPVEVEIKKEPVKPATVNVVYTTHIQNKGWETTAKKNGESSGTTGSSLRLEGIKIKMTGDDKLGIQYTTHCQDYGWLAWSSNGEMSGTEGESKRLEAIMIKLTGADKDKYDVYYRVHAQNVGWMNWAKNGEAAGTAGYAYRLEAIQIQVVKKGEKPSNTGNIKTDSPKSFDDKNKGAAPQVADSGIPNLSYRTHVQNVGWQAWKTGGGFSGTSGRSLRLEGINIKLSNKDYTGGIRYKTHIQNIGWEKNWRVDGEMSGTSGRSLRLEAIEIELYGDMAKHYDVYYRVHAQNVGWMGWAKNGTDAGTAGYARRLEGIQIVLVEKGGAAPSDNYAGIEAATKRAFISK